MALPVGVLTAVVRFGPMIDDQGVPFAGKVTFTASRPKVWAATGTPIMPRALTVTLDETGQGEIVLPATDQDGFTDGAGNAVKDWTYRVQIDLAGRGSDTRSFQVPTGGQPGVVMDLDLLTPVPSSTGVVVAQPSVLNVAGLTGGVTASALAAALAPELPSAEAPPLPSVTVTPTGADHTAAINTALGSGARRVSLVGDFTISGSLVVPSNVTLDAYAATVTCTSTQYPMVKNQSAGHATNRDQNVAILGGTWTAGSTDGATHRFHLHRVDGVTVRDAKIRSTSGKYAVLLADVTKFTVSGADFNTASDGVHVTGPATDGLIENLTGTTHDDFVALGCSDYLTYDYSRGDISRVTIRGLKPQNTVNSRGVLMFLWGDASITDELHMRDVSVSDVSGTVGASAVFITAANLNNAASSFDNITVDNVRARPGVGYALCHVNSVAPLNSFQARNLQFPSNVSTTGSTVGLWVQKPVPRVVLSGVTSAVAPTGGAQVRVVSITADVSDLIMSDVAVAHGTGSAVVNIGGSGSTPTVGRIVQSNIVHAGTGANGANIVVSSGATLTAANLTNVLMSGASATNFVVRNQSASTPTISIGNVVVAQNSRMINLEGTGGAVLAGSGFQNLGTTVQLGRTAAQTLRCRVPDFPVDVALLGKATGDAATNTNAALACGAGAVISDGSQWKNLYSGAATTA